MINLQWLMDNVDTFKEVIAACCSDETAEDIEEFKEAIQEGVEETSDFYQSMVAIIQKGVDIALDIIAEPLQAADPDLMISRGISEEAQEARARLLGFQAKDAD